MTIKTTRYDQRKAGAFVSDLARYTAQISPGTVTDFLVKSEGKSIGSHMHEIEQKLILYNVIFLKVNP